MRVLPNNIYSWWVSWSYTSNSLICLLLWVILSLLPWLLSNSGISTSYNAITYLHLASQFLRAIIINTELEWVSLCCLGQNVRSYLVGNCPHITNTLSRFIFHSYWSNFISMLSHVYSYFWSIKHSQDT